MTTDPTTPLFEDDRDFTLELLASMIREEIDTLMKGLPEALTRQWEASPVPKPREDTSQRASGDRSDPTADVVADPRRLAVRDTVKRSERVLRDAAVRVRAVRLAMDKAVARFDGEDR